MTNTTNNVFSVETLAAQLTSSLTMIKTMAEHIAAQETPEELAGTSRPGFINLQVETAEIDALLQSIYDAKTRCVLMAEQLENQAVSDSQEAA